MKNSLLAALCALLIQIPATNASNWNSSNPFVDMMRSMLNMFEIMQLYQGYSDYPSQFNTPYRHPYSQFNQRPFAQSSDNPWQNSQPAFKDATTPSIDGLWSSDANTLLLVQQDYAQIYWSRTQYRNYYLRMSENQLIFTDAETGHSQSFDMAIHADQMALRDKNGKQQLFRRLPSE